MNQRGTTIGAWGTLGCNGTQSQSLPARTTEKCFGIHDCPEASLCLRDSLCFSSTSLLPSLAFSHSCFMIPSLTSLHTIADSLSLTSCMFLTMGVLSSAMFSLALYITSTSPVFRFFAVTVLKTFYGHTKLCFVTCNKI